jgi:hypothetical protein
MRPSQGAWAMRNETWCPIPGTRLAEHNRLTSGTLLDVFHVLFYVTELCLGLAENFLDLALGFQRLVAYELAGDFLDLAFRFLHSTFDLVLVDAHDFLLKMYAGDPSTSQRRELAKKL